MPVPEKRSIQESLCAGSEALIMMLVCLMTVAQAQNPFSSGSTGADGALDLSGGNKEVVLPESGVLNYTTVNIPAGRQLTFKRNARNTPVTMLASGDINISGYIFIDGADGNGRVGGFPGPGGFRGGDGGFTQGTTYGLPGDGPGGGTGATGSAGGTAAGSGGGAGFRVAGGNGDGQNPGQGGYRYGTSTLLPLMGGSGGGGGSATATLSGGGGGGGGGAILIASSTRITFGGGGYGIFARGGSYANPGGTGYGGGGAGGAIRLIANTITGTHVLNVQGNYRGSSGFIRVEAFDHKEFNPTGSTDSISFGIPGKVFLSNPPTLAITTVGGVAVTTQNGSFHQLPDVTVPLSVNPDAVVVVLEGKNLATPAQSAVAQVTVTEESGRRTTVNSTEFTVTTATATATVKLPASGVSIITASVTLDVLIAFHQPLYLEGERIHKMEIATTFGGASEVTYITASGRRIKRTE